MRAVQNFIFRMSNSKLHFIPFASKTNQHSDMNKPNFDLYYFKLYNLKYKIII